MKVGVGVLTFNHIQHGREQDFKRTWSSIAKTGYAADLHLLTNGSTDGTEERVAELGGIVDNGDPRIYYGNTRLIEAMGDVDLVVLSADDLVYERNWLRRLVRFIEDAPDDIALFSCQLEPVWGWNTPRELLECGGEKGLVRDSVPGSSWAFRRSDWYEWMGPFPKMMPGEDLEICNRIKAMNRRMVALDLVEHVGVERSAWGNKSHEVAEPLDRAAWGSMAKYNVPARSHSARTDAAYVNLRSRLPGIVSELQSQTNGGSKDLVDDIIKEAKSRVPVGGGDSHLRDAIHWEQMDNGWRVVAGDRDHFYGHIVEFGSARAPAHPFLVPAVESFTPKLSNYYKKRYKNLDPRSSLR